MVERFEWTRDEYEVNGSANVHTASMTSIPVSQFEIPLPTCTIFPFSFHSAKTSDSSLRHDLYPQTRRRPQDLPRHTLLPNRRQMFIPTFYPRNLPHMLHAHSPIRRFTHRCPCPLLHSCCFLEEVSGWGGAECECECSIGEDFD